MVMRYPKYIEDMINLYPEISNDDNHELIAKYKKTNNPEIREILIMSNLRLIAYLHSRWYNNLSIDHSDLFMQCINSLSRAIDKYDPNKGGKFSTVAGWEIRHDSNRYLTKNAYKVKVTKINKIFKNDSDVSSVSDLKKKYPKYNNIPDDIIRTFVMYDYIDIDSGENIEIPGNNIESNTICNTIRKLLKHRKKEIDCLTKGKELSKALGIDISDDDLVIIDNKVMERDILISNTNK